MRVIILAVVLSVLPLFAGAAEKTISVNVSNVQHQVAVPQSWTTAQGKLEWRNGPKGEETLSLYLEPGKSLSEALANNKARFAKMFGQRSITTTHLEDAGSKDGIQWTYVFTSTYPQSKMPATLYYQRYMASAGKIFYLQYRKAFKEGEDTTAARMEGKRLTDQWKIAPN